MVPSPQPAVPHRYLIRLRMAGATLRDRMLACMGAFFGILIAAFAGLAVLPGDPDASMLSLLVAPIGASAVLAFVVPSSPLAQPWSVVGGNIISALVGLLAATLIPDLPLAAAAAVAFAIVVMTFTRSLHPPGGACALTMVIASAHMPGQTIAILALIALNSVGLVAAAWLFHRLLGRSYPHRVPPAPDTAALFHQDDIRAAVLDMGDAFDVTERDLQAIFERAAQNAKRRKAG